MRRLGVPGYNLSAPHSHDTLPPAHVSTLFTSGPLLHFESFAIFPMTGSTAISPTIFVLIRPRAAEWCQNPRHRSQRQKSLGNWPYLEFSRCLRCLVQFVEKPTARKAPSFLLDLQCPRRHLFPRPPYRGLIEARGSVNGWTRTVTISATSISRPH